MYAAEVNGQRLTFRAEAVWRRNMIMRDRETGSLWQQATGEALIGPLQGVTLNYLPSQRTAWADWSQEHPDSLVAQPPEKWGGALPRSTTERVLNTATNAFSPPGLTDHDDRLPWDEPVIGVDLEGEAATLPLRRLQASPLVHATVGEVPVLFVRNPRNDQIHVFRRASGERYRLQGGSVTNGDEQWDLGDAESEAHAINLTPIAYRRTRWLGWYEFHPDTTVLGGSGEGTA